MAHFKRTFEEAVDMKNKKPKKGYPKRSYEEVMEDLKTAECSETFRKLHKEMKRSNYGSIPLFARYPLIPTYMELLALISISITVIVFALKK